MSDYARNCWWQEPSRLAQRGHLTINGNYEPMIESAQQGLGGQDFWAAKPLILPSDAGAIRARRRLMQLRKGEVG